MKVIDRCVCKGGNTYGVSAPVLVRKNPRNGNTFRHCVGFPLPDGSYVACGVPLRSRSSSCCKTLMCHSCSSSVNGLYHKRKRVSK
jgi:hypothetical protein